MGAIPSSADMYVDGAMRATRSPALVRSLFPGAHEVVISQDGFLSFKKIVHVAPLETTFIEGIALIADVPVVSIASSSLPIAPRIDIKKIPHTFDGEKLVLHFTPFELWRTDEETGRTSLIARLGSPILQVLPVPETGILLMVQNQRVLALQLGDRDPVPSEIIIGTTIRDAFMTDGALYFSDERDGARQWFQRVITRL